MNEACDTVQTSFKDIVCMYNPIREQSIMSVPASVAWTLSQISTYTRMNSNEKENEDCSGQENQRWLIKYINVMCCKNSALKKEISIKIVC